MTEMRSKCDSFRKNYHDALENPRRMEKIGKRRYTSHTELSNKLRKETENLFEIILRPQVTFGDDEYKKFESDIVKHKIYILDKFETKSSNIVIVHCNDSELVHQISNRHPIPVILCTNKRNPLSLNVSRSDKIKRLYWDDKLNGSNSGSNSSDCNEDKVCFAKSNQSCNVPEGNISSTTHSLLGEISRDKYKGENSVIIVWDFYPESESLLKKHKSFKDREGGPVILKRATDASNYERDYHGSAVADVAGGNVNGIAKGAKIYILPIFEVLVDRDIILEIAEKHKDKLVLVNMSFAIPSVIPDNLPESKREELLFEEHAYNDILDEAMWDLKKTHKNVLFIAASGNYNWNICNYTEPRNIPGSSGNPMIMWPRTYIGSGDEIVNKWVRFVGATESRKDKDSDRIVAPYSNFGTCVDVFTHGSVWCTIGKNGQMNGIDGTSFSAPAVCGMLALLTGMFKTNDAEFIYSKLLELASTKTVKPNQSVSKSEASKYKFIALTDASFYTTKDSTENDLGNNDNKDGTNDDQADVYTESEILVPSSGSGPKTSDLGSFDFFMIFVGLFIGIGVLIFFAFYVNGVYKHK